MSENLLAVFLFLKPTPDWSDFWRSQKVRRTEPLASRGKLDAREELGSFKKILKKVFYRDKIRPFGVINWNKKGGSKEEFEEEEKRL